jgi:hypothetical protein
MPLNGGLLSAWPVERFIDQFLRHMQVLCLVYMSEGVK